MHVYEATSHTSIIVRQNFKDTVNKGFTYHSRLCIHFLPKLMFNMGQNNSSKINDEKAGICFTNRRLANTVMFDRTASISALFGKKKSSENSGIGSAISENCDRSMRSRTA